jgi:hypothetical protein
VRVIGGRRWVGWLAAAATLVTGGCLNDAAADPGGSGWPPAAAGGACRLLDYDVVAERLGTRFDTAGAGKADSTLTCALTQQGRDYPDLTLAVTPTRADKDIFDASIRPDGAVTVPDLGRVAYRLSVRADGDAGPAVEVGWLSDKNQIVILRYTFPPGAPQQAASDLTPGLVALAARTGHLPT